MIRKLFTFLIVYLTFLLFCIHAHPQSPDPAITLSARTAYICPNQPASITAAIEGQFPIWVTYEALINGNLIQETVFSNSSPLTITLLQAGSYTISSYGNATATVTAQENFSVEIGTVPGASLTGGGVFCTNEAMQPVIVNFSGTPPWELTYQYNYGNIITTIFYNSPAELSATNGIYNLRLVKDSHCIAEILDTAEIMIYTTPVALIDGNNELCPGETAVYSTNACNNCEYGWVVPNEGTPGGNINLQANNLLVKWDVPGDYELKLSVKIVNTHCTSNEAIFPVKVYGIPDISETVDTTACLQSEQKLILNPATANENKIHWLHNNDTAATVEIFEPGIYYYETILPFGCSDTGSYRVTDKCIPQIHVPEAFSPNGDGINDYLEVFGISYSNLRLYIYSISGEQVYSMFPGSPPWDGKINGVNATNGTYFWKAFFTDTMGESFENEGKTVLVR